MIYRNEKSESNYEYNNKVIELKRTLKYWRQMEKLKEGWLTKRTHKKRGIYSQRVGQRRRTTTGELVDLFDDRDRVN